MTNLEYLKSQTVAHWERMIEWVKRIDLENLDDTVMHTDMFDSIKESWFCADCSYCKIYIRCGCRGCPLARKYGGCEDNDSSNINGWRKVNSSGTWREWLKNAELFLEQLKTL